MNTQNVNTAASESSERWVTDPEIIYWMQQEDKAKTAVSEINETQFLDALCVMYPVDWWVYHRDEIFHPNTESFKSAEMYHGNVTSIYVREGDRYFTFRDVVMLNHHEIMQKVGVFIETKGNK